MLAGRLMSLPCGAVACLGLFFEKYPNTAIFRLGLIFLKTSESGSCLFGAIFKNHPIKKLPVWDHFLRNFLFRQTCRKRQKNRSENCGGTKVTPNSKRKRHFTGHRTISQKNLIFIINKNSTKQIVCGCCVIIIKPFKKSGSQRKLIENNGTIYKQ